MLVLLDMQPLISFTTSLDFQRSKKPRILHYTDAMYKDTSKYVEQIYMWAPV